MVAAERDLLLALAHARFLRARERISLAAMLGSPQGLVRLSAADLAALLGRRIATGGWDPAALVELGEQTARRLAAGPIRCLCWGEEGYPALLAEIYDPPATLFHRGELPGPDDELVAVVGTRLPTGAARAAAFRLALDLARAGVVVVSGLARGIDRAAAEGCVLGGGRSVAVLASGVDIVSPAGSRTVARRMLEHGGVLASEYPPGTPPRAWLFPERNRLISGLCRSVVVVQAPDRSGALITADYALEQGRDLYVHAAGIEGSSSAGSRRLAEAGATAVRSAAGIMADWQWRARDRADRKRDAQPGCADRNRDAQPAPRATAAAVSEAARASAVLGNGRS